MLCFSILQYFPRLLCIAFECLQFDVSQSRQAGIYICRVLAGDDGIKKLAHLIRSYFKLVGHHIQFNVTTAETLREAQQHPEQHRDLIVRVAGYSDYFCDVGRDLQEEIIARTEQQAF